MTPTMKYQPYWGYGTTQPFAHRWPPTRIRTRSDWRIPHDKAFDERLGREHKPWKRWPKKSTASTFEKRDVHRRFRQECALAIRRELQTGESVSHAFRISGDYID